MYTKPIIYVNNVTKETFQRCPKCGYKTAEGSAGGVVCDNCGWYYREYKYTPPETPLYGVIGGPMGACNK
jgi:ribosomal protein L37AE/L43A